MLEENFRKARRGHIKLRLQGNTLGGHYTMYVHGYAAGSLFVYILLRKIICFYHLFDSHWRYNKLSSKRTDRNVSRTGWWARIIGKTVLWELSFIGLWVNKQFSCLPHNISKQRGIKCCQKLLILDQSCDLCPQKTGILKKEANEAIIWG